MVCIVDGYSAATFTNREFILLMLASMVAAILSGRNGTPRAQYLHKSYCLNRISDRFIHTVITQELGRYRVSLERFMPRSFRFQNIALCKRQGKDQPVILTDEWPNFSCTAVFQPWTDTLCFPTRHQRKSRLMLLSSCEEKLASFLKDSRLLQEGAMIASIDSITNQHLDNVAKTMFTGWQKTVRYPMALVYYTGKTEDISSSYELDTDQFFISKLTPEHADFIGEYWTYINNDVHTIKKYFRHILTMYDASAGIFTKSDPSYPVSWVHYSDFGHAIGMHTLPKYHHKGFSAILLANVYAQLQQKGIIPGGELFNDSVLGETAGKFIIETLWRDSITGECYF